MKKFLCFFTIIFMVMVSFVSCSSDENDYWGDVTTPSQNDTVVVRDTVIVNDTIVVDDTLVIRTPVYVDIIDGDTLMRDADGGIIRIHPDKFIAVITCQDTVMVSADKPWALMEAQINPQTPMRNYFIGISSWVYNHRTLSAKDSIRGEYRGIPLSLYPYAPCYHEVEEFEEVVTDTTTSRNVHYVLYIRDNVMNHAPQVQGTTTGNVPDVPEFQAMLWKAWHVGPATAIYADGQAIVTCPDSLRADEYWDNGEYKNPLRVLTHSKNTFSVAVSGTEVSSLSAVVGKDLTVIGNKASVAEFTVTVTRTSKEIVEKNVPYTYNGRSINFVDSLHACGYKLKGGKVLSETNVRIIFVRENGTDEVSVDIPVTITEKRRIVAIDSTFIHINYVSPAGYSNGIITVSANHNAEFTLHYNDGGIEMESVAYKQQINWRVSYDTEMTVEDLSSVLGRHAVVDGKVTIEGYDFVFNFVNVVCDNILFNGKNYKAYAPKCSAEIVAITIETNKLVVEIVGDHDDDNSTIYVELPLNVTQIKIIPGKILGGNVSDSYTDQYSARVTWQFIKTTSSSSSKKYQVYSKLEDEINFVNHEEYDSFGYMSESDPFAFWYDQNAEKHLGTFSAIKMDANQESYLILYKDMNLSTVYTLGTAEEKLSNKYRNPNRGLLQKVVKGGKTLWTFDYKVYYRGTED